MLRIIGTCIYEKQSYVLGCSNTSAPSGRFVSLLARAGGTSCAGRCPVGGDCGRNPYYYCSRNTRDTNATGGGTRCTTGSRSTCLRSGE